MRKLLLTILLAVVVVGAGFYFDEIIQERLIFVKQYDDSKTLEQVEEIKDNTTSSLEDEKISLPEPLVTLFNSPEAMLSIGGVLEWTNIHRETAGLSPLALNQTLSFAAELKVDDMFDKQYFDHVSPIGVGVPDIMSETGYDYISVGENLALGNYKDDKNLVQAWMDSPPHKENVLNSSFTEVGISVKKGLYEGVDMWMAVQEFGRPKGDCPYIDENLLARIESNKKELATLEVELDFKRQELLLFNLKRGSAYNTKANQYNSLVAQYNTLVQITKSLVNQYNISVSAFNECIK
jgi:hypothetical protein